MAIRNRSGSAALEAAAFLPVIALFILIAFQMSALLSGSIAQVGDAEASAEAALREWESSRDGAGLSRPCLELMDETNFRSEDGSQEVRVVSGPLCQD